MVLFAVFCSKSHRTETANCSGTKKERKKEEDVVTHPRTQMTAPTTDKTKATKAKGNPSKKPNGLQSPILPRFFFSDPTLRLLRLCPFVITWRWGVWWGRGWSCYIQTWDLWTNSKERNLLGRGFVIPFHICNCRLHVCYVIGPNYPRDIKIWVKFVQVIGGYFRSFSFQKLPVLFLIMVKNRSATCVWRIPQSLHIFILELYYHPPPALLSNLKMLLFFFNFFYFSGNNRVSD